MPAMIECIDAALDIAESYGNINGEHHKAWVIDQMVRALCGTSDRYERWVHIAKADIDENGNLVPDVFDWNTGVAP